MNMNKIFKISLSSIILLSSSSFFVKENTTLASEKEKSPITVESLISQSKQTTQFNQSGLQSIVFSKEPQKVVQNPGSMNWQYRNTQYGSTKFESEGIYYMKRLIYDGVGFAVGGAIAKPAASYIGGLITDRLVAEPLLKRDKVYYYKNVYYTAKDSVNIYVRCDSYIYSDSARTKLVYSTWAYHTY